jgi:DNA-binding HxlR family transcriptional regulator
MRYRKRFKEPRMTATRRSGCPINLALEVFGDRWSLIVLRDMMFGGRRHFRELLNHSQEGISSNILADRLRMLMRQGMITRGPDPTHKQKAIYSLTDKAIALVPVFAQLGAWGRRCGSASWPSWPSPISGARTRCLVRLSRRRCGPLTIGSELRNVTASRNMSKRPVPTCSALREWLS